MNYTMIKDKLSEIATRYNVTLTYPENTDPGLISSGCFVIYMVTWVGVAKYKINHREAK